MPRCQLHDYLICHAYFLSLLDAAFIRCFFFFIIFADAFRHFRYAFDAAAFAAARY